MPLFDRTDSDPNPDQIRQRARRTTTNLEKLREEQINNPSIRAQLDEPLNGLRHACACLARLTNADERALKTLSYQFGVLNDDIDRARKCLKKKPGCFT